ncbi:hypothetical protein N0V94_009055 [Neodidymelliopsis sp. IMI 364377]|nr:hypothetical protein N0V94_009055 [Neodidymelliopsis sp. IMI 364377]
MNESFTSWFLAVWTLLGCLFTIFFFFLTVYITFGRGDSIAPDVKDILSAVLAIGVEMTGLRVVQSDVEALKMAAGPHGESLAEMLRTLRELRTDLQGLVTVSREIFEAVTRLRTDSQPATPVLLEILTDLRKVTRGDPKIQRGLRPFSFRVFMDAQAEALARERMQATPNPFHDLD